ncbi:GGDEF domain-containing protein [Clostridium intestinale]|uniref:GGDEF domain-containing protein n=1 Tax=Clostridium intestinale TaxID=36845 RepID=A0A7D6ZHG5_9CLOT|nr:GGDEF domain-containing protein [Clostridium intestinale]QLY79859.1 GGDEF domain-containing protein [Clostridium intestinale]
MLNELTSILNTNSIFTLYQPIVSLLDGDVVGYEILSRGPISSPLHAPSNLFEVAKEYNKTAELELLCKKNTSHNLKDIDSSTLLFINVDPLVFEDTTFKQYILNDFLRSKKIQPSNIVFEINENTNITNYYEFNASLNDYIDHGYKIALDDLGTGNSGLKTLTEIKPNYIKIDMYFIRNIDTDSFKQKLVESFVKFANSTNIKVIAEGIETKEELETLISLGVFAGQGYYLGKPSNELATLPKNLKNFIINCNNNKNIDITKIYSHCIGEIARIDKAFPMNCSCKSIKDYCDNNLLSGVVIVEDNIPKGLVMKYSLDSVLATQFGVAVFSKRPVRLIMDTNPLIIDYFTSVYDVSRISMTRKSDNIYDYIIITKNDKYYGVVTIQSLLDFTTQLEYNYARHLSPLTELPGNALIEKILSDSLRSNLFCCVLYLDLDNFKVYNDCYGFENGDKIIKYTAKLIERESHKLFSDKAFVGHIGGDDFICMFESSLEECKFLCENIISEFDLGVVNFFNEKDSKNKYIECYNRAGNKDIFPLTSISIGGFFGNINNFNNTEELAMFMSSMKKEAKKIEGSSYVINQI